MQENHCQKCSFYFKVGDFFTEVALLYDVSANMLEIYFYFNIVLMIRPWYFFLKVYKMHKILCTNNHDFDANF